jgi:hypothetical protein
MRGRAIHKEEPMKWLSCLLTLALVVSPALAATSFAQAKTHDPSQLDLLEGRVVRIDKDKSTVEVRQSGPSMVTFTVAWDGETYFSHRNEASSLDKLGEGGKVICLGTFDEGNRMMAKRIDMRGED